MRQNLPSVRPKGKFFVDTAGFFAYNACNKSKGALCGIPCSIFLGLIRNLHKMEGYFIMARYTREDIIKKVKESDVEFIRMQFTDIFGQLKNVAITKSQIEKALDNQITIDGSSIEGFTRIHESDQRLYP